MDLDQIAGILPLLLILVVFWFLVLRPARRRQRDAASLQESLAVGDRIMLTSGIYASVLAIDDESLQVEAAAGVALTVHRQAVAKIIEPSDSEGTGQGSAESRT